MEPFDLTLQQVNLEEKDITEYDTLHSFSNLVSFDSEFTDDKSGVTPVLGKSVSLPSETDADKKQTIFSKQYHGGEEVFPVKHHLVGSFASPPGFTRHLGDSVAIEPSEDSFIGFTDAADALALRKSVIGPASSKIVHEDKVASVLADAEEKLLMFNDTLSNSSLHSVTSAQDDENSSLSDSVSTEAVVAEYRRHKQTMSSARQRELISEHTVQPLDSNSDAENVNEFNRKEAKLFSSPSAAGDTSLHSGSLSDVITGGGGGGGGDGFVDNPMMTEESDSLVFVSDDGEVEDTQVKQLIPIPGDQLVKHVEKRSSGWFAKKDTSKAHGVKKIRHSSDRHAVADSSSADGSPKKSHSHVEQAALLQMDTSSLSFDSSHHTSIDSDTGSLSTSSVIDSKIDYHDVSRSPSHIYSADSRASNTEMMITVENTSTSKSVVENVVETRHITNEESVTVTRELTVVRESPDLPPLKKTHPMPHTMRDMSVEDSLRAEIDRLLRENAKLEGKLEVLENESAVVIKERSQLQSQLAMLQQQLRVTSSSMEEIKNERDAVVADLETLKLNRNNLEQVIMNAKKLLQNRDEDIKTLKEDLQLSHEANEKLQKKIKEDKMQQVSDQSVIQDLKAKIAELYVDFQMSNQDKILADSEIKSLQSEIKSLAMAKEWYQEQLQLCQDAKAALQKEVSSVKADVIAQTTMVERLKADNIHIKQLLTEAEQRALSEKEKLAYHLEAIESQMMEREATFAQLQQQKESIEATLQQRLDSGQQDMSGEVAEELKKAQHELRRRQATISVLEHEQTDLVKRLTLSQESILERDKSIESLGRRLVDTEVQLQQVQLQLREKEDEFLKLKDEKSGIEVEVDSLKKEKQAINVALQTLKSDMGKVESSFKHMKQELRNKQQQIEQLTADNNKLTEQLWDSQKAADMARVDGSLRHESLQSVPLGELSKDQLSDVEELQKHVTALETRNSEMAHRLEAIRSESSLLIEELRSENRVLEETISELKQQLEAAQKSRTDTATGSPNSEVQNLNTDLQAVQEQLAKWKNLPPTETTSLINQLLSQQATIKSFICKQEISTQQLIVLLNSVIVLNENLANLIIDEISKTAPSRVECHDEAESDLRSQVEELHLKLKSYEEDNMSLKQQYSELMQTVESERTEQRQKLTEKEQLCEQASSALLDLQEDLNKLRKDKETLEKERASSESMHSELTALQEENVELKSKLGKMETETHKQIAKQKAKALKLGKDLEAALKLSHQQKHEYDTVIKEYEEKLSAIMLDNTKLQEKLQEAEKKFSLDIDEKTVQLQNELHEVHKHYEEKTRVELELRKIVSRHEVDMSRYITRIEELQQQLDAAELALEQYRNHEEDTRKLMLELEREKGRLAGALQSHTALKEHTSTLEAALAEHESSNVQINSEIASKLEKKQKEATYLKEQMEHLEKLLEAEKQNSHAMEEQLMTEKADHVKIRRELENLFVEHDQLKVIADGYQQTIKSLNDELNKVHESDGKHRAELEHLSQEMKQVKEERERFFVELEARRNKEPVIQEQIKSLQWQVTEKDSEITALKEQLDIIDQRQLLETSTLTASLQSANASLNELREELMSVKQERTILLTRVAELKAALQASIQHIKLLQQNKGDPDRVHVAFDITSLENVLKEVKSTTVKSKPLSFLQATLSKLRGEISGLQSQVDEHAMAVQSTSKAWKEFEEQVRDLREVCKMSAADRAASEKIILEGQKLSQNLVLPAPVSPEGDSKIE